MKILYVHGYNGSKNSTTVVELQKALGDGYEVIAESFDYSDPAKALGEVFGFYFRHSDDAPILIGNSLGGFFANECGKAFNAPVVLINPSVFPEENLKKYEGVPERTREAYRQLRSTEERPFPRVVIVGGSDFVVSPAKNAYTLKGASFIEFPDMGHVLTKYGEAAAVIKNFANQIQGT